MNIYTLNKSLIKTVSAPCGSGKTFSTVKYIKKYHNFFNHLYVAPTQILIDETKKELISNGINPTVITSISHPNSVGKNIIEYLKTCEPTGVVLLITWSAYINLKYFHKRENWKIFIDEIPQADQFYFLNVHQHRETILDHVELDRSINETIGTVNAKNPRQLENMLEQADDITNALRPFYSDLINNNKKVFVDLNSWTKILEANHVETKEKKNRVFFLSMLNENAFHKTTLIGANLKDSMLHHWLKNYYQTEFIEHHEIMKNLRFQHHPSSLGERLRINYLLPDRGHSKSLMKKPLPDGRIFCDLMDDAVLKHMDGRHFLYAANKDYAGALKTASNAKRIPTISHGLNCYTDSNIIYFGPALNRQPMHQRMLNQLGISSQVIKNSTLHESAYQAIMRTSLRDPESEQVVECIVPEYETALRLGEILGGASIKWISEDSFKKIIPLTQIERNRRSEYLKQKDQILQVNNGKEELIDDASKCESFSMHSMDYYSSIETIKVNSNLYGAGLHIGTDNLEINRSLLLLTLHSDLLSKDPSEFTVGIFDQQSFIKLLRDSSKVPLVDKDELFLINPTVFNNSDPEGFRRKRNFIQSSMMVLDFDGGDLSINEFEDIFWNKSGSGNKRSFIICNSFSRSEDEPNRFRVFMFYKQPAHSIEEHHAVYDSIVNRLEQNGFTEDSSKLDRSCRNGNQSFWVPCINRLHPEYAYFKQFGTKTRDIERFAIDPEIYARTALKPISESNVVNISERHTPSKEVNPLQIEEIKDKVKRMSEKRHTPFFSTGVQLLKLGLSYSEVEMHLKDIERFIGKEKFHWTRDAMKSYKKPRFSIAA